MWSQIAQQEVEHSGITVYGCLSRPQAVTLARIHLQTIGFPPSNQVVNQQGGVSEEDVFVVHSVDDQEPVWLVGKLVSQV